VSNAWSLTGNAGTNPATMFLGTTDNQPLVLRTNNIETLRIDTSGHVTAGTIQSVNGQPGTRLEAVAGSNSESGLTGTSLGFLPGVVGRMGNITCTGLDAVVGCAANGGAGVKGDGGTGGVGVFGTSSTSFGVRGQSDSSVGVSAISNSGTGVDGTSTSGIGVHAQSNSNTALNAVSSSGNGVQGSSAGGIGVFGTSTANRGVVGTLGATSCPGIGAVTTYGAGGCGGTTGNGVVARTSDGISGAALLAENDSTGSGSGTCCDIFLGYSNSTREARISGTGEGFFNGGAVTGGADYAESMPAEKATSLRPGDVLVIDPRRENFVRESTSPNSPLVAGVYSTKPSLLAVGSHRIDDSLRGDVPVGLVGIVPTRVTTQNGPIHPGDLLTTSSTPGYAMKASHAVLGTILGKALQPLKTGKGMIKVLVTLR